MVSEILFVEQVFKVVKVLMSDIIFFNQVVKVSPDNEGGMVWEDEHWVFLKRLLLSKENDNEDTKDDDDDDGDDDDHLLSKEKGKEGRVSREDGAVSSQRVRRRHDRHVRDEHRLAHRLHHIPAIRYNVAQTAVSRL